MAYRTGVSLRGATKATLLEIMISNSQMVIMALRVIHQNIEEQLGM